MTKYIYVIVREDLTPAQRAVQACHASIEASRHFLNTSDEHPHLVLLSIEDEEELLQEMYFLSYTDIRYKVFREADLNNEITALATEPICGSDRERLSHLELLGG